MRDSLVVLVAVFSLSSYAIRFFLCPFFFFSPFPFFLLFFFFFFFTICVVATMHEYVYVVAAAVLRFCYWAFIQWRR